MDTPPLSDYHFRDLEGDLSINLADTVKINKSRFEDLYRMMNQNGATVFFAIGLHFDKVRGMAFPVISGSNYISRELAIQLLKECILSMDTKLIEDAEQKKV